MLQMAGVTALAAGALPSPLRPASASASGLRQRFARWIVQNQITQNDLCRYFRFGPHESEESPLATAYAILFLNGEKPDVAERLANGLVHLQERYASNRHVGGGVPSIANDGSELFYASDALAATKALTAVYARSRNPAHLHAAGGFVEFVQRMSDGKRNGFLVENLNFPMQYASPSGAIQNWLVPNVGMLFWDALSDYAEVAGDAPSSQLFERGRTFLLRSTQAPNGAYYDHYEPGYPPRGYADDRWRWFKIEKDGRRIAIGDNMMMSSLGAQRLGDQESADRFLRWAKPHDGAFYAYIDVDTGGSGFQEVGHPYFDVVCSAMYYQLLVKSRRLTPEIQTTLERVFASSSARDGGYRWGFRDQDDWVQGSAEALVTGYWIAQT
jgi:hypothetical protein